MERKKIFKTLPLFGIMGILTLFLSYPYFQTQQIGVKKEKNDLVRLLTTYKNQVSAIKTIGRQHRIERSEPDNHQHPINTLLAAYEELAADPEVDEKYPQREWLQMLLEKGIVIENYDDYSGYLAARRNLIQLEKQPELWTSDMFGLPPIYDWETFKASFIERKIWEYEQFRAAIQADSEVTGGFFTGPDKRKFLPTKKGRVYVKRKGMGTVFLGERLDEDQQKALLFEGRPPAGYEVIHIDHKGYPLTEVPPLLTLENVSETPISSAQEDAILEVEWHAKDTSQTEGKMIENQQNRVYEPVPPLDDDFDQFLDSLSLDEPVELERLLTRAFSDTLPEQHLFEGHLENEFPGSFSSTQSSQAEQTLKHYRPKERIRQLTTKVPGRFEQLENYRNRDRTPKKGERK